MTFARLRAPVHTADSVDAAHVRPQWASVEQALAVEGEPLDSDTRATMERAFGFDFRRVRIHTDDQAGQSVRALGAAAYTIGDHIAIDAAHCRPGQAGWNRLLTHELTHVVQQRGVTAPWRDAAPAGPREVGDPGDASEWEARTVAERLASARPPVAPIAVSASSAPVIRRQPRPGAVTQATQNPTQTQAQTATGVTQQLYDDAVRLIGVHDARMAGYLRPAHVQHSAGGTASNRVRVAGHSIPGAPPGSPTDVIYDFQLQVVDAGTAAGATADYAARPERSTVISDARGTVRVVLKFMVITLRTPAPGPNAAADLADRLYHEGLHMLLDMDEMMARLEPTDTAKQSGQRASEQAYATRVRAQSGFPAVATTVAGILGQFPAAAGASAPAGQAATAVQNQSAAQRVLDRVIEERYVVGQANTQMGGRETWSELATADYLRHFIKDEVALPTTDPPGFQTLVTQLTTVLNAAMTPAAPPATSSPTGASTTPAPTTPPPVTRPNPTH
jgi:hypothetical protein